MRPVATCGVLLLLLLIVAAFVVARRSPDAGPSPASMPAGGPHLSPVAASRPLARTGVPEVTTGLVICCGEIDFGDVDPDEAVHLEIPWHRLGAGVLAVREVRTGCGCLHAGGLPETIPERAHGTLLLDVRVPTRPGPFQFAVRVLTDRPPDDVARIDLCGFSGHEVSVEPAALDLRAVPRGKEVERVVSVRFPAALPDAPIRASLHGVGGVVSVHPPLEPHRRDGRRSERGADLLVRVLSDIPGPIEGVLEVVVSDRDRRWLPIHGSVSAD